MLNQARKKGMLLFQYEHIKTKAMKTYLLLSILFCTCIRSEKDFSDYYSYHPPEFTNDGINVGTLEEVGLDTQMLAKAIGRIYANKYDQVHSFLIYKDGLLVFEEYMEGNKYAWDGQYYYGDRIQWHRDSLHMIMSCTKSITSAIIGIAFDKGYFDVHESIFKYLPDHQQYRSGGKENITIEHLLTMTSGLEWDEWSGAHSTTANDIDRIYIECQRDPLSCILERNLSSTPGEKFTYNGGNMIILGEILRNAVGVNILDFGNQYLFEPLGIDSVYWYHFDNGVFACDGSIKMTPRDMIKIGVTFLNEGTWNGQRIISKEWVEKSKTTYKNNTGIRIPIDDTGKNGYAYTWWTNEVTGGGKKSKLFQASGWGGQEIIVLPDLNMVVVFTGGNYVVKKHYYKILEMFVLPALD
jgi:CubicO group peptidase (beta-lactamase class C family)